MKIAGLINNDIVNGEGIHTTLYMQGCPHHCPGCFSEQTWDPEDGIEIEMLDLLDMIFKAISENGIQRNFTFLGGEPLAPYNIKDTLSIASAIKLLYPDVKIYLWTGYCIDNLPPAVEKYFINLKPLLDVIIDGPFVESEKDTSLHLRGSRNQRIIRLKENLNE